MGKISDAPGAVAPDTGVIPRSDDNVFPVTSRKASHCAPSTGWGPVTQERGIISCEEPFPRSQKNLNMNWFGKIRS